MNLRPIADECEVDKLIYQWLTPNEYNEATEGVHYELKTHKLMNIRLITGMRPLKRHVKHKGGKYVIELLADN